MAIASILPSGDRLPDIYRFKKKTLGEANSDGRVSVKELTSYYFVTKFKKMFFKPNTTCFVL